MDAVEEIKAKLNIVDVISPYVQLKKVGINHKGVCPFHKEKTPSFIVSEVIQRYKCFGCNKSGDIFNFIQEIEGIDFYESLKILAEKANVKLDDANISKNKKSSKGRERVKKINKLAATLYNKLLTNHKSGEKALDYLENRGVKLKTINEFLLGYSPNNWTAISSYLLKKGYDKSDILKSGLAKGRKDNSLYDLYRGRLIFPFFDSFNNVIGFSARSLDESLPKYINTPETELFHKKSFLYGLNLTKKYIRQEEFVVIVEGMMDIILPYQNGIKNIVATGGTSLTSYHIKMLKRYTDTVVLLFDSDIAGFEASIRAVDIVLKEDLNLKIGVLEPKYKDPDEAAVDNIKSLKKSIEDAVTVYDYYFIYVNKKYDMESIFDKKKASDFILEQIKKLENEIVKSEVVKKYASFFGISENVVYQLIKNYKFSNFLQKPQEDVIQGREDKGSVNEEYFLALLINSSKSVFKKYIKKIDENYFTNKNSLEVFKALKNIYKDEESFDLKHYYDIIALKNPELIKFIDKISLYCFDDNLSKGIKIRQELSKAYKRLKDLYYRKRLKLLSQEIKAAETASNMTQVEKLQKEYNDISKKITRM